MDQLEEIKSKIDTVSLISEYLPLKKAGRNFKALCPFHSEKTSSFIVSPERQIWHCFGCQRGGDIFGFLMQMENLEFSEALEILAKRAGVKLVRSFELSEQAKLKEKILKINHLASEFYHYLLLNHQSGKTALTYVLGRGVKKQSMETFKLGWAPNMWDGLMKFLTKKGYTPEELEKAGLIIKGDRPQTTGNRYYDRFRARLMFTLRDHRGNVIGFAGRTLGPKATEAKYINSPETPLYTKGNVLYGLDVTKEAIKREDQAIVVEGEFDLISSFQAGVANVVAIKGTALTEGQLNLLKRFSQTLSLALDTDLAGDVAARRGIETAEGAGFSIRVVKLPTGKDPDECARINPGLWQKAVKDTQPVFDYFIDSAISRFGDQTAEGKKKVSDEILPILARISNPIVQAHYLTQLAKALAVSEEVISRAAQKLIKQGEGVNHGKTLPVEALTGQTREELLEEHLLALILQRGVATKTTEEGLWTIETFLKQAAVKKIFNFLRDCLGKTKKFKISEFVETLPSELVPMVDRAYLKDLSEILDDEKSWQREWEKTTAEIKKNFLRHKLLTLAEKMNQPAKEEKLQELSKECQETSTELRKLNQL